MYLEIAVILTVSIGMRNRYITVPLSLLVSFSSAQALRGRLLASPFKKKIIEIIK